MAVTEVYTGSIPSFSQVVLFSVLITIFFVLIGIAIFMMMRRNRYFKPVLLFLIAIYFIALVFTYAPYVIYNVRYNATSNSTTLYLTGTGADFGTILFSVAIVLLVLAFVFFFYIMVTTSGTSDDFDVF